MRLDLTVDEYNTLLRVTHTAAGLNVAEATAAYSMLAARGSIATKAATEAEYLRRGIEQILDQVDHEGDDAASEMDRAFRFLLDESGVAESR